MTVYGYAKGYTHTGDGTLMIQVRVPSIHGPYKETDFMGQTVRNYTRDADLPYYPSLLLPHLPNEGEVVAVMSLDSGTKNMLVIGLTGASYLSGATNLER